VQDRPPQQAQSFSSFAPLIHVARINRRSVLLTSQRHARDEHQGPAGYGNNLPGRLGTGKSNGCAILFGFALSAPLARLSVKRHIRSDEKCKIRRNGAAAKNSEYLPQRRKGRKGRRMITKSAGKIVYLSLPNLACLASWRELFPWFGCYRSLENLRKLRKLSSMVVQRTRRKKTFDQRGTERAESFDPTQRSQRCNLRGRLHTRGVITCLAARKLLTALGRARDIPTDS